MTSELFEHFLITRFSYRGACNCSAEIDPLDKRRLERRFEIFEAVCLPSVLAQRASDFIWILIVDAALPLKFRQRLHRLIGSHDFVRVHVYEPGDQIDRLGWLKAYSAGQTGYIMTTALDDDDALCVDYVSVLHEHIHALASLDTLPDIRIFGCTRAVQWDYYPETKSPLGYLKPWSRRRENGDTFPLQSGFTAFVRQDCLDCSAYFFRHSLGDLYLVSDALFARLAPARQQKIEQMRAQLKHAIIKSGQDWNRLCEVATFVDVSSECACVLMVNTMTNLQDGRLFENRDMRQPVLDESSFPGFCIDLDAASRSIPLHGCTLSNLFASLVPFYKAVFRTNGARSFAFSKDKFKHAVKVTGRSLKGAFELRRQRQTG